MYAISRNYYDRKSNLKWLTRTHSQSSVLAAAVGAILALNVTFVESNQYESGFGCSVVASAEKAHWVSSEFNVRHFGRLVPTGAERLSFDGYHFNDPDGKHVYGADALFLLPDGHMYAVGLKYDGDQRSGGYYPKMKGPRGEGKDVVDELLHKVMNEGRELSIEDFQIA